MSRKLQAPRWYFGRRPSAPVPFDAPRGPDWAQAEPEYVEAALARALTRNGGGWLVVGGVAALRAEAARAARAGRAMKRVIAGRELVVWADAEGLRAAPDRCPHMGARLSDGHVDEGRLVCPWHGLKLDKRGFREWQCLPTHDDGVLFWVRMELADEVPTDAPILAPRPADFVSGVIQMVGRCAPEDILANRLDPWHGAHFHPYSFRELRVMEKDLDVLRLRVTYRAVGPLGIEVDATFHCPDPRTIVMTIVDGDGVGSVVETHATPLDPGRTAMTEATLATSDRGGWAIARRFAPIITPLIQRAARRLWVDDIAYAERRYALRTGTSAEPA
ncbi:MAG: Rieske (2Fe-2S) protein [Deltaproteobacteria bacterium]|nr:Rieske (2Fe-2S) protein [Deltaproteobacteria bacterium]